MSDQLRSDARCESCEGSLAPCRKPGKECLHYLRWLANHPLIGGYREWAAIHYPLAPGWNSGTDLLLRRAWMDAKREALEAASGEAR